MTTTRTTSLKAQGRGKLWFTKLTLRDEPSVPFVSSC